MMIVAARLIQQRFRAHVACSLPTRLAVKSPRPEFKDESANKDLYHELRMVDIAQRW